MHFAMHKIIFFQKTFGLSTTNNSSNFIKSSKIEKENTRILILSYNHVTTSLAKNVVHEMKFGSISVMQI